MSSAVNGRLVLMECGAANASNIFLIWQDNNIEQIQMRLVENMGPWDHHLSFFYIEKTSFSWSFVTSLCCAFFKTVVHKDGGTSNSGSEITLFHSRQIELVNSRLVGITLFIKS